MAFPNTIIMGWITVGPELIRIGVLGVAPCIQHLQPHATDEPRVLILQ